MFGAMASQNGLDIGLVAELLGSAPRQAGDPQDFDAEYEPVETLEVLLHQLTWTVVLVAFGRWLVSRGTRRLVVQGG